MEDDTLSRTADPVDVERLLEQRSADIVEFLNDEGPEVAAFVLGRLPADRAIRVVDQPELENGPEIFGALPAETASALLSGVSADRAAALFRQFDDALRSRLLGSLDRETAGTIRGLLAYPPQSAGSIMTTEFVSVPSSFTVAETLALIRRVEGTRETVYAIYVLDPETKLLVQTVTLRRLISGEPSALVLSVALPRAPVTVEALADQEDVARLISKYDLLAVPVVERGRVLGIVTVDDVIDAMVAETTEDVHRFGGVGALAEPYMDIGFVQMIRKRAGWLSVLFLSEMLTASAMQYFQTELEKAIVLTLFIPLIMSSGGNSGSQATSLLIRSLALQEVRLGDWWRVALREVPTGLVLGAILGAIGAVRIVLWQKLGFYDYGEHWALIAATVAAALVGIVTFGSFAGSMLPFVLQRTGFDPASASAPFVATLVDVTGLVIYFGVAALILTGTLL